MGWWLWTTVVMTFIGLVNGGPIGAFQMLGCMLVLCPFWFLVVVILSTPDSAWSTP